MRHPLGRLALLHPFPSALNALLVAALATVSGAGTATVAALALAMLGFQTSIGALNDLVDMPADGMVKPSKPLPSGLVSARAARAVVVVGAGLGLALSLLVSPVALLIGGLGYACGVAYDLWLKRRGLGWLAFTAAFPLLLLYAWTGAGGGLPPGWTMLLPLAAMAGPALQLANALADLDDDLATGGGGPAVWLGRGRAVVVLAVLTSVVYLIAWALLWSLSADAVAAALAATATMIAVAGVVGSASRRAAWTAWGWSLQAVAIAGLALAWVLAAAR